MWSDFCEPLTVQASFSGLFLFVIISAHLQAAYKLGLFSGCLGASSQPAQEDARSKHSEVSRPGEQGHKVFDGLGDAFGVWASHCAKTLCEPTPD